MSHDPRGSGSLLMKSLRWAGRRRPRRSWRTIQQEGTAAAGQSLRESRPDRHDRHPSWPASPRPAEPRLTDRLGSAVGDAAGIEAGQELLPPRPQGPSEPGDLRDRAGGERVEHALGDGATIRCPVLVVGRSQLLVAVPGDLDLAVLVSSVRSMLVAHDTARTVSFARAGANGCASLNERTGQLASTQRQSRLDHRSCTGRPNAGASASRCSLRPRLSANTPQPRQPAATWSVYTESTN